MHKLTPKELYGIKRRKERIHAKLPESDKAELQHFEQFLEDARTMPRGALYAKHQDYLALTDEEVKAASQPSE